MTKNVYESEKKQRIFCQFFHLKKRVPDDEGTRFIYKTCKLLTKRFQDLFRIRRQVADAHTGGVGNGVDHRNMR